MKYIRTEDAHTIDTSICEKVIKRTFNGEAIAVDSNHFGQDSNKEISFIWFCSHHCQ